MRSPTGWHVRRGVRPWSHYKGLNSKSIWIPESVGDGKGRFAVAIDSLSEMLRYTSISSVAGLLSNLRSHTEMIAESLVPKVQFNLELSEKERNDREKVVLPFEHQGIGKTIQIYDRRKSPNEDNAEMQYTSAEKVQTIKDSGRGEIIYFRDSDDEMPDLNEDPDDDLDI
ncbi:unnamed protein product [Fraxinus pennsylvanica]|uniref:Elongator complex protein 5 n=1 Tax=Fraxinus pennsylvanica TaxID=56036 RepID=A0AAD2E949_9LAMI|nr:unnamed protein product [Fraxinus pennsylvanica]